MYYKLNGTAAEFSNLFGVSVLPSLRTNTATAARAAPSPEARSRCPEQDGQRDDKCRRNGQCEAGHNRRHQRGLAKGVRSKASRCCHVSGLRRPRPLPRRLSLPTRARNGANDAHRPKASGRHRQPVHRDEGRCLAQPDPALAAVLSVLRALRHAPPLCAGLVCLPSVHLIGGWHMFAKEALSFLHQIKQAPHASWAPDHDDAHLHDAHFYDA